MSEKIVYEMGLVGVESVVSKIAQVNAAFSNISIGKLVALEGTLRSIGETLDGLKKNAIRDVYAPKKLRSLAEELANSSTQTHFLNKFLTGQFFGSGATAVEVSRWLDKRVKINELKSRNRAAGAFFGYGKEGMRRMLNETFGGGGQLRLPYYSFLQDGFDTETSPVAEIIKQRHNYAEALRMQMKRERERVWDIVPYKRGDLVPQNPNTALAVLKNKYGIVNTGRVTDPGYIDAESWYTHSTDGFVHGKRPSFFDNLRWAAMQGGNRGTFFRNLASLGGMSGAFGKVGLGVLGFNLVMSSLAWFGRNLSRAAMAVNNFGEVILQAREGWRQAREAHFYGTTMGSLAAQWKAIGMIGGDAASASALWNKLSSERAMIGYGGSGGAMMEAARLFGLNILGSGEYGYATNDELMRNVARLMPTLDRSGQIALANTLGLDPHQFWMLSHGEKYYNYLSNQKSLLGLIRSNLNGDDDIGKEIFSQEHTDAARRFEGAWKDFTVAMKEFGGVLGEAILPLLTIIIDFCNGITQVASAMLKPFASLMNLLNIFSARFWQEEAAMSESPTAGSIGARIAGISASGGDRAVTLNMGDISLNSLGLPQNATVEQISERLEKSIFDKLGDHLVNDRR